MPPDSPRLPRALTEADLATWASYARLIAPLPGHAVPEPRPVAETGSPPPRAPTAVQRPRVAAAPVAIGLHPPGVDGGTWARFRSGKLRAGRVLDLHGHTAQRAFHALGTFLRSAHAEQVRCVEVITGRGVGENGGVIRRELPLWLNRPELRALVLAAAHPHAANTGSVRLLLRRVR